MTPEEKVADLKSERKKLCDDFENMKAGLESQIATLGERCNQLLKDKGNLQDTLDNQTVAYETLKLHDQEEIGMLNSKVAKLEQELQDLKDRHAEEVELHLHAEDYIKSLEQQIEKMKRCANCKYLKEISGIDAEAEVEVEK
jgi:tRNA U34 5-carboxymethylaminomethyl modifying enzyme MnmG/GidA